MNASRTTSLEGNAPNWWTILLGALVSLFRSIRIQRREKALRVCETLPLGDRRFLAVVQFEGRRFLIGATHQSISLLDRLEPTSSPAHKRDPSLDPPFLHGVH